MRGTRGLLEAVDHYLCLLLHDAVVVVFNFLPFDHNSYVDSLSLFHSLYLLTSSIGISDK